MKQDPSGVTTAECCERQACSSNKDGVNKGHPCVHRAYKQDFIGLLSLKPSEGSKALLSAQKEKSVSNGFCVRHNTLDTGERESNRV